MFRLAVIGMPQQDAVAQRAIPPRLRQVIIGAVRIIGIVDVRLTVVDGIIGLIRDMPHSSRKEGRVHRGSRYARVGAAIAPGAVGYCIYPVVTLPETTPMPRLETPYEVRPSPSAPPGSGIRCVLNRIPANRFARHDGTA